MWIISYKKANEPGGLQSMDRTESHMTERLTLSTFYEQKLLKVINENEQN